MGRGHDTNSHFLPKFQPRTILIAKMPCFSVMQRSFGQERTLKRSDGKATHTPPPSRQSRQSVSGCRESRQWLFLCLADCLCLSAESVSGCLSSWLSLWLFLCLAVSVALSASLSVCLPVSLSVVSVCLCGREAEWQSGTTSAFFTPRTVD